MWISAKYAATQAGKGFSTFAAVFALLWFFSMWREPHPIESFSRVIYPHVVVAGQYVSVSAVVYRTKHRCSSVVRVSFVDETGTVIDRKTFSVKPPAENPERYDTQLLIPGNAKPGFLDYRVTANFRCNIVQELIGGVDFPLPDVRFTVQEAK